MASMVVNAKQVSVSNSSSTAIIPANASRVYLEIRNIDASNFVDIGPVGTITAGNGHRLLKATAPMVLTGHAAEIALNGLADTAAVVISYLEVVNAA